jgi:hypothetical protein
MLTQNKLKELFNYCNLTGKLYWKVSPNYKTKIGMPLGCIKKGTNYSVGRIEKKQHRINKLIWLYHKGYYPTAIIDHIDGDSQNNKIENLREVTAFESSWNTRKKYKSLTSPYKGVHVTFKKDKKYYTAFITNNKIRYYLGSFSTAEQAAEAYNKKAIDLRKNFAILNTI